MEKQTKYTKDQILEVLNYIWENEIYYDDEFFGYTHCDHKLTKFDDDLVLAAVDSLIDIVESGKNKKIFSFDITFPNYNGIFDIGDGRLMLAGIMHGQGSLCFVNRYHPESDTQYIGSTKESRKVLIKSYLETRLKMRDYIIQL